MRIKINFKCSNTTLPINNQHIINSYIHKCLGKNNQYHDNISNYNISMLCGGKLQDNKLFYKDKAFIIVSSIDMNFINNILIGIMNNQILSDNIIFNNVEYIKEEFYNGINHFATLSPILLRKNVDGKKQFITINNDDYALQIKTYLINKLKQIDSSLDFNSNNLNVIIKNNNSHKIKKILIKNVINHASSCHISIECNKNIAELIYNIGIGHSTGSGFGTIYKTENKHIYAF